MKVWSCCLFLSSSTQFFGYLIYLLLLSDLRTYILSVASLPTQHPLAPRCRITPLRCRFLFQPQTKLLSCSPQLRNFYKSMGDLNSVKGKPLSNNERGRSLCRQSRPSQVFYRGNKSAFLVQRVMVTVYFFPLHRFSHCPTYPWLV